MESNDPFSQSASTGSPPPGAESDDEEDEDIAFAAEAAANAVEEADAEQQRLDQSLLRCRICGQGVVDGRPLLRFLPMNPALATLTIQALPPASPSVATFPEDICLHIFCGKTASILPTVNQPDMEILTKAGLKNKHGIGAEVNAALARTRCASILTLHQAEEASSTTNKQEKQYFLVREFEAHLAAIRSSHLPFMDEHAIGSHTMQPPGHRSSLIDEARARRQSQRTTTNDITPSNPLFIGQGMMNIPANDSLDGHSSLPALPLNHGLLSQSSIPKTNQATTTFAQSRVASGPAFVLPPPGMTIQSTAVLANNSQSTILCHSVPYTQVMTQQSSTFMQPQASLMLTHDNFSIPISQIPIPPPLGGISEPSSLPTAQQPLPQSTTNPSGLSSTSVALDGQVDGSMPTNGQTIGVLTPNSNGAAADKNPIRATAGKPRSKTTIDDPTELRLHTPPPINMATLTSDGKVKCECGGTYLQTGTSKGTASWRSHVITKRHQRWIRLHGLSEEAGEMV